MKKIIFISLISIGFFSCGRKTENIEKKQARGEWVEVRSNGYSEIWRG